MTEEIPSVEATGETAAAAEGSEAATVAPGKCTRLPVLTAVLRQKFHSNRQKDGRFTAGIACLTTGSSKLKFLKKN
jgi:Trp operon repressor